MNLDDLAKDIHKVSVSKGFWDKIYLEDGALKDIDFMLSKLALLHSEISEILEATRKQMDEEKIVEECVDVFIRLMDWYQGAKNSGWVNSSFDDIYQQKMEKNMNRPPMHGNLA